MKTATAFLFLGWAICLFGGCSSKSDLPKVESKVSPQAAQSKPVPYVFLGIPENEESEKGPVGLIGGQAVKFPLITKVEEVPYSDYEEARQQGQIHTEETHDGYVYFAIEKSRDVPFDNASAHFDVMERGKAKLP